eukprot:1183145-Prorocentrum_minimum.AAC.3
MTSSRWIDLTIESPPNFIRDLNPAKSQGAPHPAAVRARGDEHTRRHLPLRRGVGGEDGILRDNSHLWHYFSARKHFRGESKFPVVERLDQVLMSLLRPTNEPKGSVAPPRLHERVAIRSPLTPPAGGGAQGVAGGGGGGGEGGKGGSTLAEPHAAL